MQHERCTLTPPIDQFLLRILALFQTHHMWSIYSHNGPHDKQMCAASSVFTSYWKSSSHQNQTWSTDHINRRKEPISVKKMFKKDAGWWIKLIKTQKSSKGWHWPRRVVSRHPGLPGLLTWRMRFALSRYLDIWALMGSGSRLSLWFWICSQLHPIINNLVTPGFLSSWN